MPGDPLSPLSFLATSMHAQKGVYALLLGSGVSTGAGMPTGWGVVTDLIQRVAASRGEGLLEDPAAWWRELEGEEPGYSAVLEKLSQAPGTRAELLARYFEPTAEERADGIKMPTVAHRAIAELVSDGYVQVVLTTNFDRLVEDAIREAGVQPQVIDTIEAIQGMRPLTRGAPTVVKLHGDYQQLNTRNTVEELSTYPEELARLLSRVFDEYGLVVAGWSAEWDHALVDLIKATSARRYPMYWDSRSSKGEAAKGLIEFRDGRSVPAADADALFSDLRGAIRSLEGMAQSPLTTAMTLATAKRYLTDPTKRVALVDLFDDLAGSAQLPPADVADVEGLDEYLLEVRAAATPLARTLYHCVRYADASIDALLAGAVRSAVVPAARGGQPTRDWELYPAVLATYAVGLASLKFGRDDTLLRVLNTRSGRPLSYSAQEEAALGGLMHPWVALGDLLDNRLQLPRFGGTRYKTPVEKLLQVDLQAVLKDDISDSDVVELMPHVEFRIQVANSASLSAGETMRGVHAGAAADFRLWHRSNDDDAHVPRMRLERAIASGDAPAWASLLEGSEVLAEVVEQLRKNRRY
ncbi:SIR2 family protein [Agrococcus citreus]|uniref:SIR2-like domain-containing protein n=1 Tax=Agrococcus citreus TaxID=84643 RepID=A0ABP4JFB7_9MICO